MSSNYITIPGCGGGGSGGEGFVSSLNGEAGDVQLLPGIGISITETGAHTITIASTAQVLTFADSIVNNAGTVTLVNDSASPAASSYYGTDSSSVLGYHLIPEPGITALTGDVTATGPGSSVATLATVNPDVGSFTTANITVNAKGLITAASNGTALAHTAKIAMAGTQSIPGGVNTLVNAWDTLDYDTNSFFNFGAPSRLTIPAGFTRARFAVNIYFGITGASDLNIFVQQNGSIIFWDRTYLADAGPVANGLTGWYPCAAGDYFEVVINVPVCTIGGNVNFTTFSIEVGN